MTFLQSFNIKHPPDCRFFSKALSVLICFVIKVYTCIIFISGLRFYCKTKYKKLKAFEKKTTAAYRKKTSQKYVKNSKTPPTENNSKILRNLIPPIHSTK